MYSYSLFISVIAGISFACLGEDNRILYTSKEYAFKRIFEKAETDPKWNTAKTLTDRIWLVRTYSSKFSVVSNPVSDRYMITCYGGPVDLVHFLGLAAPICSGEHGMAKLLYQEWDAEGGPDNIGRFNYRSPPHATPDDLPSNALGALFGFEIRKHNDNLLFDLEKAFEDFVRPLVPVPDKVARMFSHHQVVMVLPENPSRQQIDARNAYFTAEPLLVTDQLNKIARETFGHALCDPVADGIEALGKAGFRLLSHKDQPIVIRRTLRQK